jgi:hypothetical protein
MSAAAAMTPETYRPRAQVRNVLVKKFSLKKVEEDWLDQLNLIATDNKCRMQQNYALCRRLVAWFGEARKTATADVGGEDGERDSGSCSLPT